jgi:hypothetical protein
MYDDVHEHVNSLNHVYSTRSKLSTWAHFFVFQLNLSAAVRCILVTRKLLWVMIGLRVGFGYLSWSFFVYGRPSAKISYFTETA